MTELLRQYRAPLIPEPVNEANQRIHFLQFFGRITKKATSQKPKKRHAVAERSPRNGISSIRSRAVVGSPKGRVSDSFVQFFRFGFVHEWSECRETKFVGPQVVGMRFDLRSGKKELIQSTNTHEVCFANTVLHKSDVRMIVAR